MSQQNKTNGNGNRIYNLNSLDPKIQHLIKEAVKVRSIAYCPFSNFQVGACVQCEDGSTYTGCNIENRSFTVGICAERVAYSKAISEGKSKFKSVAVVAQQEQTYTPPCGACRQFMSEFGNVDVYLMKPTGEEVLVTTLDELLPYQFVLSNGSFT